MVSSTSIQVTLLPLPSEFVHGILKGYLVTYRRIDDLLSPTTVLSLQIDQLVVELTDLNEFTAYSVQASAITSKGQGPRSVPILVTTAEDGTLLFIYDCTVTIVSIYELPRQRGS